MRRFQNEFSCTECEEWVPHTVLIAESEKEYERARNLVPTPFAEFTNGDITKQFDCSSNVNGSKCNGKVNITYLKKDIRTSKS